MSPSSGVSVTLGEFVNDPPGAVAITCAAQGWRVFPLRVDNGNPRIKKWQLRATTDTDIIDEWWNHEFINAPVGITTGPGSGIWVLDLDVKNGVNGVRNFLDIQRDEQYDTLPDTFTVRSRSGSGRHLYWAWPSGVDDQELRNAHGVIGRGIDVKGAGGYVRAPLKTADVLVPVRPASAPSWLLQRALEAQRTHRERRESESRWHLDRSRDADDELAYASRFLMDTGSGRRNTILYTMSRKLAEYSDVTGINREVAWDHMRAACQHNGLWDDDGPEQCMATFNSGWNTGIETIGRGK